MNSKDKEQIEEAILKSQLGLIEDLFNDTSKTKSSGSKISSEIIKNQDDEIQTETSNEIRIKNEDDETAICKSVELSPTGSSSKSSTKSKRLKNRIKSKVNDDYELDEYDYHYDDRYDKYYENI